MFFLRVTSGAVYFIDVTILKKNLDFNLVKVIFFPLNKTTFFQGITPSWLQKKNSNSLVI